MKIIFALSTVLLSFTCFAGTDDLYSVPGKVGRVSPTQNIFEIVGFTALLDHDGDEETVVLPAKPTPRLRLKAAIDMSENQAGDDNSVAVQRVIEASRRNLAFTIGMVYQDAAFEPTTRCIGKDYQYENPDYDSEDSESPYKICIVLKPKHLIIK